jgi:aspartate kinase
MVERSSVNIKEQAASPATLVMKFGGTSVGSPDAMAEVVEIVRNSRQEWPRMVVVTSALAGVTNMLLDSAASAEKGQIEKINPVNAKLREVHLMILDNLVQEPSRREMVLTQVNNLLDEFSNLCRAIGVLGEATPRALDAVASLGERMSARVLAAALEDAGIPAQPVEASGLIVTDDCYQDAHPDLDATLVRTRRVLEPVLNQGIIPVVTGFLASNAQGVITTLGRGGSDYSAGILGAVLPADDVWIWTDVDGIMSADPRIVPQARTIPELTYREIAELAYYGAKVLHPKTIRPVIEAGIGLRICNTFNPTKPGTRLVEDARKKDNGEIKAVTAIQGQRLITIEGRGMLGVPGVAARAFSAVASTGTSVPLITQASSEQSICFAVPMDSATQVVEALEEAFAIELNRRDIDRIWASNEVVIVTVVGAGMIHTPGIAGRVFSALGSKKVNVIAIAQGSSEVSISLVVDASDASAALCTLHELIVPKTTVQ